MTALHKLRCMPRSDCNVASVSPHRAMKFRIEGLNNAKMRYRAVNMRCGRPNSSSLRERALEETTKFDTIYMQRILLNYLAPNLYPLS